MEWRFILDIFYASKMDESMWICPVTLEFNIQSLSVFLSFLFFSFLFPTFVTLSYVRWGLGDFDLH